MSITEDQEDEIYVAQEKWIKEHFGSDVAKMANYGWGVDEVEGCISTKVYGRGVLTTSVHATEGTEHTFEPFGRGESLQRSP